ncbi:3-oxoacyl-ACP synthase [Thiohalorhabdus denitrificans]|uniref:beta-ketoacyl-ACP synthase II n=1 Tax=Thiohalorhabdus denitrificans TaxID=381306 RepID=UPI0006D58CD9|nr:beta-ketoacyl-ACP synthase II [Thiohalorhabdus denitrificans]KPV40139.1 3-oxoacyl-ACP synthase [Thiohalorhabdus denitrificans]
MLKRRVVITGVGMVTPVGATTTESWEAIVAGRSGIDAITRFDASDFPVRIAGEVNGFEPGDYIPKKEARKMDTFIHYGLGAASMAMDDSGLEITEDNAERVGVAIGSGIGGLPFIEKAHESYMNGGPRKISPFFIPASIINMVSGHFSIIHGTKGPNVAAVTACATGTHAIGDAARLIQYGDADAMVAGGTESCISPLAVGGFAAAKALSTNNDDPRGASRPFDAERDGFILGEGAGVVVLEEREAAIARGARIYAEVGGYGMSADAYHMTAPSEDGEGASRCMELALRDAELAPEEVDYVNAHGTSTPTGDRVETMAVKRVFGDHASKLAVSSTKSMVGHMLGAAGGVESIVAALAVYHGVAPPTINLENPDPECDLDYVPGEAREMPVRAAVNNSFGFGGTNATLVLKRA